MHRMILGLGYGDERKADHENHDTLDNRRSNLRVATTSQNGSNSRVRKDNTSGFKGVGYRGGRFLAYIRVNGKRSYLGTYGTAVEAALAYDAAAREHFGEYACTNFAADARVEGVAA